MHYEGMEMKFLIFVVLVMFCAPPVFVAWLYFRNRGQTQHSLLRGQYWFAGILRYIIEKVGPEFRFYITDDDNAGKPISRVKFVAIVKATKYLKTLVSFGSKRDFSAPGIYLKNSMFPLLNEELEVDNSITIQTKKYVVTNDGLFFRDEITEDVDVRPWHLTEDHIIVVGNEREHPWKLKGLVGMSGMSYGALGPNAITALSKGIGMAGASWMNTGEGSVSPYHLSGGCDIVFQIGPGLFGVRDKNGNFDWDELRGKAAIPEVKAFELKLGQGAKIRGGHVEGVKVTPEIAAIRGVEPWKNIDSPNRFSTISNVKDLFDFVGRIQDETGLPVGVKIVMGDVDSLDEFCEEFQKRGRGPDFITIDGSEGGTGATFKEIADSLGIPINSAIIMAENALCKAGVRDKIKIIAAGKLHMPDEVAMAIGLGADLVAIARGFMISVGCIMTEKCHSNKCPVAVATTNPEIQRALYVDEKKYRVMNYIITLRAGLFSLSAACGLKSPTEFTRRNLVYRNANLKVANIADMFPGPSEH
ncbi:Ferredoxin-dependent glutamate synthase [hydrothermal vent metagenome]|uniref:Ferredoxin-dependent glutamate synthase n=1 Tax=hydrothermal vent metagenome TaxID=652676 RepID=A0A3B1C036_9ZZZZ